MAQKRSPETYRLAPSLRQQLSEAAKAENQSKSAIVRIALTNYLESKNQKK